jgi:hypothetical protein
MRLQKINVFVGSSDYFGEDINCRVVSEDSTLLGRCARCIRPNSLLDSDQFLTSQRSASAAYKTSAISSAGATIPTSPRLLRLENP